MQRPAGLGDVRINVNPPHSDARLAGLPPRMNLQP
jgi:hypothetical protein